MKKMITVTLSTLFVASIAALATPAAADNDDDLKPGGKGAITTYKDDRKTVVKVEACKRGKCINGACIYSCTDAGRKADKFMRAEWCKDNKGKKWFFQAGNRKLLANSCR